MSEEKRRTPSIKFVNLHSHTGAGSPFDALDYPQEHLDYVYLNGMDAFAITEHGNANSIPYQVLHTKKMAAEGKELKPIFGAEIYYIPSISDWQIEYDRIAYDKKKARQLLKDDSSGTVVENEEETRNTKSILNRRHHLLLLAQNQQGLNNLFKLISLSSQKENFYRFPRIDLKMLRKYSKGLIATNACIGGPLGHTYFRHKDEPRDKIKEKMKEAIEPIIKIFKKRFYGEIQWNAIPEQHIINQYIIELSKEYDFKVISTVDSHYPKPSSWKDRELYKRLGWINKKSKSSWMTSEIPASVSEVGYELYPKNGEQVWESYKKYSKLCSASYDDDFIKDTITRTHEIAHKKIDTFFPDDEVRLPKFVVPYGRDADDYLEELVNRGLYKRNLQDDKAYTERVAYELGVIKDRGFSKYFLTMKAIADKANSCQLSAPARGCFLPKTRVKMSDGLCCPIEMVQVGDKVIDAYSDTQVVKNTLEYDVDEEIVELDFGDGVVIRCTKDHEFLTENRGLVEAKDLTEEDEVKEV